MDPAIDHSELLAQNAFNKIIVDDLLFTIVDGVKTSLSATLARISIPSDLVDIFPHPDIAELIGGQPPRLCRPDGPPPRQPSQLPPQGDAALSLSLGKVLGAGRSSIVYEALNTRIIPSSLDPCNASRGYLPPLAVKIGRQNRCQSIVRDAWFYDEMDCLQGVAIARFYGCFELKLGPGKRVEPWEDPEYELDPSEPDFVWDFAQYSEEDIEECGIAPHPLLCELVEETEAVYITVLERLGSELGFNEKHTDDIQEDITGVYDDIAVLGVQLSDGIHRANILAAPAPPLGIPSRPSPFTGLSHAWRAVDFELGFKSPLNRSALCNEHISWIHRIFCGARARYSLHLSPPVSPPSI